MEKYPSNQYDRTLKQYTKETNHSEEGDKGIVPDNTYRRSPIHFSTIEAFLGSLNTTTTAVSALQGMQGISLESYQKLMRGADSKSEDNASQVQANKSDDFEINDGDS